jgi:hypothetical protein
MKSREPLQIWVDNILKVYAESTEDERADGLSWYPRARRYAEDLAGRYGIAARIVSGVIAALSPMTTWEQNIKDAEEVLRIGGRARVTTYNANRRKAARILKGFEPGANLGRYKTLSFFECIEGNPAQVCIDRHASAIAYGRALTERERKQIAGVTYERLQNAYRKAAQAVNLKPSELQAITWVSWRKKKGLDKRSILG